jgi:hypothetical protein
MKIIFTNRLSGLQLNIEKAGKYLSRLASGAGEFSVSGIKDGIKSTFNSLKFQVKKLYKENPEDIDIKKIEENFKDIHEINDQEE